MGGDDDFCGSQSEIGSPKIVTDEKIKCYDKFKLLPIIIEGPEFNTDYSYFL
jgi:hypothetical protein